MTCIRLAISLKAILYADDTTLVSTVSALNKMPVLQIGHLAVHDCQCRDVAFAASIDTCWYCVGCVDSGRLSRSGCGYDSAAW